MYRDAGISKRLMLLALVIIHQSRRFVEALSLGESSKEGHTLQTCLACEALKIKQDLLCM